MALSDQMFDRVLQHVPAEWIRGQECELQEMIARLRARRQRVPALLAEALTPLPEPIRVETLNGSVETAPTPAASNFVAAG